MPNLTDNANSHTRRLVGSHRAAIVHLAKSVSILLLTALALEVFVFNINCFISLGYDPIVLDSQIELTQDKDGCYRITAINDEIEFSGLDMEIKNIYLDFDESQPAQNLTIKIQFTDEAHTTYFDTTEYTQGVPEVEMSTASSESQYLNLNASGKVDNLLIEITGEEVSYPIILEHIVVNAQRPFAFKPVRFLVAFTLLLLCFMFRPKSSIYHIKLVENPRKSKAAIVVVVAFELVLMTSYLFYGSTYVGIATASYNYGEWDGTSLVNTYEVGGDNAQQYAELARAFARGELHLAEEPPDWLKEMDNPYDKGARNEAQKETGEDYLFDVVYYNGHYYVYFGVVPVIVFYLPFYVLTGNDFPTAIGVLIAAIAFVLGCTALLDRFARYHFKRVNLGIYLLLQIPLAFCCGILYLVKFPTFYSLPIACGLAFSIWGLYCWMRGRASHRPCACYFAGSLCMALVLGCRPQLMALSLLAFPLFWRPFITKKRLFTKRGACEFACLIAPYVVVAAAIMWYNWARFGSPFDFGAAYNLTVNDMTQRGWNFGRLAPALFSYFLQAPNVVGTFPFIQATDFDTTYMGQTVKEATFGGILACLPVLWVLLFTPRILKLRSEQRSTHTITGVIIVLLFDGVIIAILDAQLAGILQRYYADFSFMFLAASVLLLFIVNENLPEHSTARSVFIKGLIVLVAASVTYTVLLCFVAETGWYSDVYPWAYQDLIELFQFWT